MIRIGVEVFDDMDGQKVVESGITVGGRDLSVIFFYSLVLVIFIIASIELFCPHSFGSILLDVLRTIYRGHSPVI